MTSTSGPSDQHIYITEIPDIEAGPDFPRRLAEWAHARLLDACGFSPSLDRLEAVVRGWTLLSTTAAHAPAKRVALEFVLSMLTESDVTWRAEIGQLTAALGVARGARMLAERERDKVVARAAEAKSGRELIERELDHVCLAHENLRRAGSMARRVALRNLVERHGFKLVHHPRPWEHPNPIGLVKATVYAQLCEGKIIATQDENQVYAITHELAHGVVGVDDELAVLRYQANMLANLFQGFHG